MLKKTIKIILFILCAALIMLFVMKILRFKSPDGIDQMHAFYENEENTVDVLFLGSSHMYTNVNTGMLWSDYGIAAYDLGGADQPFWNTYYFMTEALKTQKPKVIVAEIYSATVQKTHFQGVWTIENLFGMNFNPNFIESAKESIAEDWHSDYINRFAKAEYEMINNEGYETVNPATILSLLPESTTHAEYMHLSLALLDICDGIYLMDGWRDSKGAVMEYDYAIEKGLVILYE